MATETSETNVAELVREIGEEGLLGKIGNKGEGYTVLTLSHKSLVYFIQKINLVKRVLEAPVEERETISFSDYDFITKNEVYSTNVSPEVVSDLIDRMYKIRGTKNKTVEAIFEKQLRLKEKRFKKPKERKDLKGIVRYRIEMARQKTIQKKRYEQRAFLTLEELRDVKSQFSKYMMIKYVSNPAKIKDYDIDMSRSAQIHALNGIRCRALIRRDPSLTNSVRIIAKCSPHPEVASLAEKIYNNLCNKPTILQRVSNLYKGI